MTTPARTPARRPFVVGISGASGTPYAAAVINGLIDAGHAVDLVVSKSARLTIVDETGRGFRDAQWRSDLEHLLGRDLSGADLVNWPSGDFAAGPSSGSYATRGMVVVPASTASVAGIAMGLSKDLLQRAADVTLKEQRRLVVCVRETPFTRSTLEHMLTLDAAGAVVLPCNPAFYHGPTQMQQLVDFVAGKVLDVLGVEHDLYRRWEGELGRARKEALAQVAAEQASGA